jgi:Zn-dependent peptidase ImmA (M78 family)
VTSSPFNPEALIVARESRRRSQEEVANAAHVTQGLISKAENGMISLAPEEIDKVAAYLEYPTRLFYEPGRIRDSGSACLYHRKRKTLPARLLRELDARMLVRKLNVRRLLNGLEVEGDRSFHTIDPDEYGSAEAVANALRTAWRVPTGPIADLTALIESAGGIIVTADFGTQKLFGMSCWATRDHPFFFLNRSAPTEVLRWTLAHELGHLTMHAVPSAGDMESEADAFAGEFLAPRQELGPDLRNLSFSRLPPLKMYWRISMKAIITRGQKIGAIDPMSASRLYKQYSYRRYNDGEPFPLPPETPSLVSEAIRVHLDQHSYSVEELAEAVLLGDREFRIDLMGEGPRRRHGNVIELART